MAFFVFICLLLRVLVYYLHHKLTSSLVLIEPNRAGGSNKGNKQGSGSSQPTNNTSLILFGDKLKTSRI
ncbi:MAG: hypothetical protein EOP34_00600 [Rickettsiales bacterium]|nr:MAG: hypothetical protein EOP34_00600 [Rickettsiales bacterium]